MMIMNEEMGDYYCYFSSKRRHTRCALVTGVQSCALPIYRRALIALRPKDAQRRRPGHVDAEFARAALVRWSDGGGLDFHNGWYISEVGQNVQWRCGQGQDLLVARSRLEEILFRARREGAGICLCVPILRRRNCKNK